VVVNVDGQTFNLDPSLIDVIEEEQKVSVDRFSFAHPVFLMRVLLATFLM
jgi:hypothetical protein